MVSTLPVRYAHLRTFAPRWYASPSRRLTTAEIAVSPMREGEPAANSRTVGEVFQWHAPSHRSPRSAPCPAVRRGAQSKIGVDVVRRGPGCVTAPSRHRRRLRVFPQGSHFSRSGARSQSRRRSASSASLTLRSIVPATASIVILSRRRNTRIGPRPPLRADMPDAEAVRRAGEPAIGDQRHLLAYPLAIQRPPWSTASAHAGPPRGPFIADTLMFAFLVAALLDRGEGVLLANRTQGRGRRNCTASFMPRPCTSAPCGARLPSTTARRSAQGFDVGQHHPARRDYHISHSRRCSWPLTVMHRRADSRHRATPSSYAARTNSWSPS